MIRVIGPKDPKQSCINTTTSSKNWSRGLSPMLLGPVELYNNFVSENVENAWQYSKVYKDQVDKDNNPTEDYWSWAKKGWSKNWADRYPKGKGATPQYSFWNDKKLSYIEARKEIYIPIYSNAVKYSDSFKKLKDIYQSEGHLVLWDFDGYDYLKLGMSLDDVINCESRKMGHAFVLAMLLEGKI